VTVHYKQKSSGLPDKAEVTFEYPDKRPAAVVSTDYVLAA